MAELDVYTPGGNLVACMGMYWPHILDQQQKCTRCGGNYPAPYRTAKPRRKLRPDPLEGKMFAK